MNLIPIYKNKISLDLLCDWRNESKEMLRTHYYNCYDNQEAWVDSIIKDNTKQYYFIFNKIITGTRGISQKEYQEIFAGYCGLDKIHPANRTAEISILIGSEFRKKGYGKKAINKLLDISFNEFNLNLVYADINGNTTNEYFWERCGFQLDSYLRDRKYYNGKYYASCIMSITQKEFFDKKEFEETGYTTINESIWSK